MVNLLDDVQLGSIKLFCLVAKLGSFTAAAHELGITPAAVSLAVSRIEQRLGVRLFIRTTRQIRLTDIGQQYFEHCQRAIMYITAAEQLIVNEQVIASGTLRLSVPTVYAHYRLLAKLPLFQQIYPAIKVELHISDHNIEFTDSPYDLAIRGNNLPDSGLIAHKLEDAQLIIVATPEYLDRYGCPSHYDQLINHNCIQYQLPSTNKRVPWQFLDQNRFIEVETNGCYCCLADFSATHTLVKYGGGLMQVYRFCVEKELQSGELVEVLAEFAGVTRPFMLIYPHAKYIPLRMQVFIDFLLSQRMTSK